MFPQWYQPRTDVGAILVTSQAELDALIASGWPDKQCPIPGPSNEDRLAKIEAEIAKLEQTEKKK